jgi:hypothetical protein
VARQPRVDVGARRIGVARLQRQGACSHPIAARLPQRAREEEAGVGEKLGCRVLLQDRQGALELRPRLDRIAARQPHLGHVDERVGDGRMLSAQLTLTNGQPALQKRLKRAMATMLIAGKPWEQMMAALFLAAVGIPRGDESADNDPAKGLGDEEHERGVQVRDNQQAIAQVTFHTGHPFWESFTHDTPAHFDQLASLAVKQDDGTYLVTLDQTRGVDYTFPAFARSIVHPGPWAFTTRLLVTGRVQGLAGSGREIHRGAGDGNNGTPGEPRAGRLIDTPKPRKFRVVRAPTTPRVAIRDAPRRRERARSIVELWRAHYHSVTIGNA